MSVELKTCPDCNGKGGYEFDPNPYWLTDMEFSKPLEWRTCLTCRGQKMLTPLQYACRMANGSPIVQAKGYA